LKGLTLELHNYIKELGLDKFSELTGISTVQAWKYQELKEAPRPRTARLIKKITHGLVDYEDCYEPFFKAKESDPQLEFEGLDNE